MASATMNELVFEEDVQEFLSRHGGVSALQSEGQFVRSLFPQAVRISIRLVEDPDEENHTWVVLSVLLPQSVFPETVEQQRRHYFEQQTQREQLPYHPFSFGLAITRE
jgi:hypothetical protein